MIDESSDQTQAARPRPRASGRGGGAPGTAGVRCGRSASHVPRSAFKGVWFVTGTDTGVGKTVLTALLTRALRQVGVRVAALKPFCSGGRDDAHVLHAALDAILTLDEINPWHFRAPLAPVLAARREGKRVRLAQVVAHARQVRKCFDVVLVEGAGGLLSPLGEGFSSRELMVALKATPVIVCPNRLGAVNQARLVLAALPPSFRRKAIVVLVGPRSRLHGTATLRRVTPAAAKTRQSSLASRSNRALLAEHHPAGRILEVPWLRAEACAAGTALIEALLRSS